MALYSKCDGRGLGEFLDVFRLRFFSCGLGTVLLLDRAQGRLQHHAVGDRGHPHCAFEPLVLLVLLLLVGYTKGLAGSTSFADPATPLEAVPMAFGYALFSLAFLGWTAVPISIAIAIWLNKRS